MHINAINRIISKTEAGTDYDATMRRPIVRIKLNKYACFLNVLKLEKTALWFTHTGTSLQTTAIRNLNLEPKDGQHRLGFRHKLKQSL